MLGPLDEDACLAMGLHVQERRENLHWNSLWASQLYQISRRHVTLGLTFRPHRHGGSLSCSSLSGNRSSSAGTTLRAKEAGEGRILAPVSGLPQPQQGCWDPARLLPWSPSAPSLCLCIRPSLPQLSVYLCLEGRAISSGPSLCPLQKQYQWRLASHVT